jgi:hypothetical protein
VSLLSAINRSLVRRLERRRAYGSRGTTEPSFVTPVARACPCIYEPVRHNCKVFVPRQIEPQVSRLLEQFPAVAILGPRQVGKTTLGDKLGRIRFGSRRFIWTRFRRLGHRFRQREPYLEAGVSRD